jgi:hypothetical protein
MEQVLMTPTELAERGLRVKPLEWAKTIYGFTCGEYETLELQDGTFNAYWSLYDHPILDLGTHPTLEAAKAAAEADHAARIAAQVEVG